MPGNDGFFLGSFPPPLPPGTTNEFNPTLGLPPAPSNISDAALSSLSLGGIPSSVSDVFKTTVAPIGQAKNRDITGKNRHFTIILNYQGVPSPVTLNVNPEDFNLDSPFRSNAINTLDGQFIDVWGVGIRRLVFRGHTGWRFQAVNGQVQDGFDNIFSLYNDVIKRYFELRDKLSKTNSQVSIASQLKMYILDRLHETVYYVIPEDFKLVRNRARPLLHMYELSFIVQKESDKSGHDPLAALGGDSKDQQLNDNLTGILHRTDALSRSLAKVNGVVIDAIRKVNNLNTSIATTFQGVIQMKANSQNQFNSLVTNTTQLLYSVRQGMGTFANFADFSPFAADVKSLWYDAKSITSDLICIINQILHGGLLIYTGLVGSSGCGTLLGAPTTPLQTTSNTFTALNTTNPTESTAINSAISPKASISARKILSIDTPALLLHRG